MKKVILISFMFILIFLLTACSSEKLDINKNKQDRFGDLSYKVPEKFIKRSSEKIEDAVLVFSDYSYSFDKLGANGKYDDMCTLNFFYDNNSNDYYLEEYADIYHEGKTGTKKSINGVEWLVIEEKISEKAIEYYYYAKFNNKYYQMQYSDWGSGSLCGEALVNIEKSLVFE